MPKWTEAGGERARGAQAWDRTTLTDGVTSKTAPSWPCPRSSCARRLVGKGQGRADSGEDPRALMAKASAYLLCLEITLMGELG